MKIHLYGVKLIWIPLIDSPKRQPVPVAENLYSKVWCYQYVLLYEIFEDIQKISHAEHDAILNLFSFFESYFHIDIHEVATKIFPLTHFDGVGFQVQSYLNLKYLAEFSIRGLVSVFAI